MILRALGSVKNGCSFYNGAMPRVSAEHLAARRQQIVEAAWRCFARQGFHATSMQDVFAESGLSAGAVYRYFPSKGDLVRTIAQTILGGLSQRFDDMTTDGHDPDPEEAIRAILHFIDDLGGTGDFDRSRVAPHIWAEALHDAEMKEMVQGVALEIRAKLTRVAEAWKTNGDIAADTPSDDVAIVVYGMLIGYITQKHIVGDVDPDTYTAGLLALIGRSVPEVAGRDT